MKRLKSESELVDYRVCICACPKISWYIYEIAPRNPPAFVDAVLLSVFMKLPFKLSIRLVFLLHRPNSICQ